MNIPEIDLPRVVIIGGGFAGLKLAKTLNTNLCQVVLFDSNNYHTFQPLLYQVATAGLEPDSIAYPLRKILKNKKNFHFRMARVLEVDSEKNRIDSTVGQLEYDHLVIATGAQTNYFGMENIERNSISMKTLIESVNLRSKILSNFEKALNTSDLKEQERLMNFVIVGGGATGVELAGALAELKMHILPNDFPDLDIRRMQIHLLEASDKILGAMSEKATTKSEKFLRKLGVNVWVNTMVKDYDGKTVQTSKKDFPTYSLIWAAGVSASLVKGLKTKALKLNRLPVDEFNKVLEYDNIYAIGDVASTQTNEEPFGLPMLGSVAVQQGRCLGQNLNRILQKKSPEPFIYRNSGTMATVGRNLAVVDFPFLSTGGLFAWLIWCLVHLMLLVDFRSRIIVLINWIWSWIKFDKGIRLIISPNFSLKKSN